MVIEPRCPGPPACLRHVGSDVADFDHYCESARIQSGEEPAAFAAWLNALSGWDGEMEQVDPPTDDQG